MTNPNESHQPGDYKPSSKVSSLCTDIVSNQKELDEFILIVVVYYNLESKAKELCS